MTRRSRGGRYRPASTPVTRTNRSTNPALKNDSTGWSSSGGSFTRATGLTGLTRTTGLTVGGFISVLSPGTAVTPGDVVTISVDVRTATAASVNTDLEWLTSGGSFISSVQVNTSTSAGVAIRPSASGTAPATAATARLAIYVPVSATATCTAVLMEKAAPPAGSYFDGDTAGASWTGTAGGSTSTLTTSGGDVSLTATPQAGQVTLQWSTTRTDVTGWNIGRDGADTQGTGPWSTDVPAATTSQVMDKLVAGTSYLFTLIPHTAGGDLSAVTRSATPTSGTVDPPPVSTGNWLSGSSMDDRDTIGAWRGRAVEITAMWADSDASNQINMWPIQPGVGDLTGWTGAMDIAIGAIFSGESWASAATGAYDSRWTQCLTNMSSWRAGRTTFIRFAHELNGTWYPWSVNGGNVAAFKTAWARFYALKQSIIPAAKLVFNVNYESTGGYAWPNMWPGDQYVDVLGVDYYNRAAVVVTSSADWTAKLNVSTSVGGTSEPRGLGAYRQWAQDHGKPLGLGEWAPDSAGGGDNAAFVTGLLTYCQSNAGPGSGQIVYEILFNQSDPNGPFQGNFGVWDQTKMPTAQTAYNAFF